jgi:hypothetical protein
MHQSDRIRWSLAYLGEGVLNPHLLGFSRVDFYIRQLVKSTPPVSCLASDYLKGTTWKIVQGKITTVKAYRTKRSNESDFDIAPGIG